MCLYKYVKTNSLPADEGLWRCTSFTPEVVPLLRPLFPMKNNNYYDHSAKIMIISMIIIIYRCNEN
jgi:ArsR family metal-binding transcriptional regulator